MRVLYRRVRRIALATALMGAVLWYVMPYGNAFYTGAALARIAAVAALVAVGGVVYFGAAFALGVIDRRTLGELRRRPA